MLRRLLPAVVVVLALGSAGCADDVAPAARVGDTTISDDDLMADVREWAGNDQVQSSQDLPVIGNQHAFAAGPVTERLGEMIILAIVGNEFDRLDLDLTDEDRTQAFALIGLDPSQEELFLGGFSEEYHATYLEDWAKFAAVQRTMGDDLQAAATEAAASVEVNPRYGTWDARSFTVTPPSAPQGPATADAQP